MRRIAIARLWHEGNPFSPVLTRAADFHRREWTLGAAAHDIYAGTATEMGAAVAFARARTDWEVAFLRLAAAPPGGPVEQEFLDEVLDEIVGQVAKVGADAVYLSLHGALIGTHAPTPDLDLVRRVRNAAGAVPLAVSFDLHANLPPEMAGFADIVIGYKTYPHVDTHVAAARALDIATRAAEGTIRPVSRIVPVGAVLGSFNMRTADGPMAEAEGLAAGLCVAPGMLDVTPFGGFAYADVAHAGASVSACADGDAKAAEGAAATVAGFLRARRAAFATDLPGPERGLEMALGAGAPSAVLEPSDNPLSGGIGDTTQLFSALLALTPTLAPSLAPVFAFFWDPDLAARAHAAGSGATLDVMLGARLVAYSGPPVSVRARIIRLTDGRFVNEGPMERGLAVDLGPTVLLGVEAGGREVRVIVTTTCQSPNDAGYFALHGIDIAQAGLLCVKAKNHFRAAFSGQLRAIVDVDTPGPAAADLSSLPFRNVPAERLGAG